MGQFRNDDARLQPGVKNTKQTHIAADSAAIAAENQPIKPKRTTELAGVA